MPKLCYTNLPHYLQIIKKHFENESEDRIKQIGAYYRERITAIKNEVFTTNLSINKLKTKVNDLKLQLAEVHNAPEVPQGEITITFDAPIATSLNAKLTYLVRDAGWVPNYDIKSSGLSAPG